MDIKKQPFGTLDGQPVWLFTLTNAAGVVMKVTNYGGIVTELHVPDRSGKLADIVLGYDRLSDYVKDTPYFGALVGRYGNRIAGGTFSLGGKAYTLAKNNGPNSLHGGLKGFDKVVWTATPAGGIVDGRDIRRHAQAEDRGLGAKAAIGSNQVAALGPSSVPSPVSPSAIHPLPQGERGLNAPAGGNSLQLTYLSRDGEEGFPGNLSVRVVYTLNDDNEWVIDYFATTDAPTIVNLTQHSYFNLSGAGAGNILGTEMMIDADAFTAIDKNLIPTGELRPVKGTPMDFTRPTALGARIAQSDEQLLLAGGYDHNFILNKKKPGELSLCARAQDRASGRVLEVLTTEPGVQLYTGNFLDGSNIGKGAKPYNRNTGFCLETQHYPDSPNQPAFPSTVLAPGQTYRTTTIYKFSVK